MFDAGETGETGGARTCRKLSSSPEEIMGIQDSLANILWMQNVQKKYKVIYDSSQGTGFVVHKADGTSHVFMPSK